MLLHSRELRDSVQSQGLEIRVGGEPHRGMARGPRKSPSSGPTLHDSESLEVQPHWKRGYPVTLSLTMNTGDSTPAFPAESPAACPGRGMSRLRTAGDNQMPVSSPLGQPTVGSPSRDHSSEQAPAGVSLATRKGRCRVGGSSYSRSRGRGRHSKVTRTLRKNQERLLQESG